MLKAALKKRGKDQILEVKPHTNYKETVIWNLQIRQCSCLTEFNLSTYYNEMFKEPPRRNTWPWIEATSLVNPNQFSCCLIAQTQWLRQYVKNVQCLGVLGSKCTQPYNVSRRFYWGKHGQIYLLKAFYKQNNRCQIRRKKLFALRKPFIQKMDKQTTSSSQAWRLKWERGFHLERESLLFVAAPVYKSSWWKAEKPWRD